MKKTNGIPEVLGLVEEHPYGIFQARGQTKAFIIGTFPIHKFTAKREGRIVLTAGEVDFFYGGAKNKLWKTLSKVFSVKLDTKQDIENFLHSERISMADVVASCQRLNMSANDRDLRNISWNPNLLKALKDTGYPKIFFTSKIAQAWFFENLMKEYPGEVVVLPAPAAQAMIALSSRNDCKDWLAANPGKRTSDYLVILYKKAFGLKGE